MQNKLSEYEFDLTGGNLSLNLANTVSRRDDPERRKDHLETFADLVAFARQSGIVSLKRANELNAYARQHVGLAGRSYARAIALREALYHAFRAVAQGRPAPPEDLQSINDSALEAMQHRLLGRDNGGYQWEWRETKDPLDCILWQAALSAADLLTSGQLHTVRWCEASDCEWLFLDKSRNRSRRWCDMTSCGNRQKARRHYQRAHE